MTKKNISVKMAVCMAVGLLIFAAPAPAQTQKEEVRFTMTDPVWLEYGTEWWSGETLHVRDRLVQWTCTPVYPENHSAFTGIAYDLLNINYAFNNKKYFARMWGTVKIETKEGGIWEGAFTGEVSRSLGLQAGSGVLMGKGLYAGKKIHMYFLQRLGASPTIIDCYGTVMTSGGE